VSARGKASRYHKRGACEKYEGLECDHWSARCTHPKVIGRSASRHHLGYDEVIKAADRHCIAMVFTGVRHF
jgi:hypothetical protein